MSVAIDSPQQTIRLDSHNISFLRFKIAEHYQLFRQLLVDRKSSTKSFGLPIIATNVEAKFVTMYNEIGPILIRNEYEECRKYLQSAYNEWYKEKQSTRSKKLHVISGQPSGGMFNIEYLF